MIDHMECETRFPLITIAERDNELFLEVCEDTCEEAKWDVDNISWKRNDDGSFTISGLMRKPDSKWAAIFGRKG